MVGERLHPLRGAVGARQPHLCRCRPIPFRRVSGGAVHEDGRRYGASRRSALGGFGNVRYATQPPYHRRMPLSAVERHNQPPRGNVDAPLARCSGGAVRPLPPAESQQLRLHTRHHRPFADAPSRRPADIRLYRSAILGRLGAHGGEARRPAAGRAPYDSSRLQQRYSGSAVRRAGSGVRCGCVRGRVRRRG